MMNFCHSVLCTGLLLLYVMSLTAAFLVDNQCLAPSPCTCTRAYIICNSKSLSAVPIFKPSNSHTTNLNVRLYNNHITTIPGNAFLNISTANATYVRFDLYSNQITTIQSNAFKGVENSTKYLDLHNNNLTTLPSSLGQLNALQTLDVRNNHIHSINPTVFAKIGHSLTTLNMDMNLFTAWPTEMRFLRTLQSLTLNKIPFSRIDENAFDSFENTLTTLTILSSQLENIPNAVCHLTYLQTFYFTHNTNLTEPITQQCTMSRVKYLVLTNNHLKEFPEILTRYPSLTRLDLSTNQIEMIKAESVPYNSLLTTLQLQNNKLYRIPNAVNHLKLLLVLYVYSNDIKSIEDNDLLGLKSLTHLEVYSNPLTYISPHAFKQNTQLQYVDLDYTQLGYVPVALSSLPLTTLYLTGKPIECTCKMAYLKGWNLVKINMNTVCESSTEKVKDYIMNSLSQC